VPRAVGIVVGRRLATLHELQTVYGAQDLHDMIEVYVVDTLNEQNAKE